MWFAFVFFTWFGCLWLLVVFALPACGLFVVLCFGFMGLWFGLVGLYVVGWVCWLVFMAASVLDLFLRLLVTL